MIDVEVARTFLAVIETGTFQGAADKVHVTQSTVSAAGSTSHKLHLLALFQ